jgi:hypothetical protein
MKRMSNEVRLEKDKKRTVVPGVLLNILQKTKILQRMVCIPVETPHRYNMNTRVDFFQRLVLSSEKKRQRN